MSNEFEFQPFDAELNYAYVHRSLYQGYNFNRPIMPTVVICIQDEESRLFYGVGNKSGRIKGLPHADLGSLRPGEDVLDPGEDVLDFIDFKLGSVFQFKDGFEFELLPYRSKPSPEHDIHNRKFPDVKHRAYHPVIGTAWGKPRSYGPLKLATAHEIIRPYHDVSDNAALVQERRVYEETIEFQVNYELEPHKSSH